MSSWAITEINGGLGQTTVVPILRLPNLFMFLDFMVGLAELGCANLKPKAQIIISIRSVYRDFPASDNFKQRFVYRYKYK